MFSVSAVLFIVIDVTGRESFRTVTVVDALSVPLASATVILTEPALTPVTTPLLTVATDASEVLQRRPDLLPSNGVT